MRKAGLLDKKPLKATRSMLETARRDKGTKKRIGAWYGVVTYTEYESRYYFRAMMSVNKEILEVDLFTRPDLALGRTDPRFRIFLDREKKDFASWDMVNEKWSSAKINMLETDDDRYSYSYRGRNHATKAVLHVVNGYLHTGCMQDVEMAVLDFQAEIRKTELSKKHKLITDVIDSYMGMVPDRLPADWMKFINDRVLEHSVFYSKDTRTGYCTHCRLHVPVPADVRHNMPGKCLQCGSSITYKSWKMQKHTTYRTTAAILQKCTDGEHFVYRQFRVAMYTERQEYYEPEIGIHEDQRALFLLDDNRCTIAGSLRNYEWGEFRYTGIDRWCEGGTVDHAGYRGGNYGYEKSVLYTGNIRKLLKNTRLRYIPAAEIVKSVGTERINVLLLLEDMAEYPYEVFWKMRLRRFVQEHVKKGCEKGLTQISRLKQNPKPWDFMEITKEDMKQAVRLNVTDQQMRIIQLAAGSGVRLTDEQVKWFDEYTGAHWIIRYLNMQTPHRIIRYLQERTGVESMGAGNNNTMMQLWTDYIDMACQMGWDLHDRSVFFPQDVKGAHDEAAVAFTIWKDKEDAEKMRAKDKTMRRIAAEIRKAFRYSDDRYVIRVPECYLDFKKEGNAQHNCVARYYDSAVAGSCIILFIRKREDPDKSFCTVEIQNDHGRFKIVQNRVVYNRDAPEDAGAFLQKAVKEAQKTADKMAAEEGKRIRQKVAG